VFTTLVRFATLLCFVLFASKGVYAEVDLIPATGGMDYPSQWQCDSTKFSWYCQIEEEKEEPPQTEKLKTKEEAALEELKKMKDMIEAKKAIAILNPTPENIKNYIIVQEAVMDRSSQFADTWRRVIWQNPELNFELKRPINNAALDVYKNTRTDKISQNMAEISKEWGLFFIFKSDCPYCHRMAPSLKFLSDKYGMTVFPVSVDGAGLPDFPNPRRDNGLTARMGLKNVPAVVLGNIKDKRLILLGTGVISMRDIVERIYILTKTKSGELF